MIWLLKANKYATLRSFEYASDYIKNGDLHRRIIALGHIQQNIKDTDTLEKCTDIVLNDLEHDLQEKLISLFKENNRQQSI